MIKVGDKVRFTDKAIRECREYFGRNARLQAKDWEKVFTVLQVKEVPEGASRHGGNVIAIDKKGDNEWAECHLELA